MPTNALRSGTSLSGSCTGSPTAPRYCLEAWAYSSLLHALLFVLALGFVTSLRLPPDPLLFRLEVALTETPEPNHDNAPSEPRSSPSPPPVADRPKMAPPPQASPAAVETRPTINSVARTESLQTIERVQTLETARPVQTTQPIVRQEARSITALPRETASLTAPPIQHMDSTVNVPIQRSDAVVRESEPSTSSETVESQTVTRESYPARESQVVASTPQSRDRQVISHDEPIMSSSGNGLERTRVETRASINRPSVEAKAIAPSSKPSEMDAVGVAKHATPPGTPKSKPSFVNIDSSPARSTSFGWLAEAIKRSERQRKPVADHEGTTRFHITMRQDGLTVNLLELSIVESSGYLQVDRAAADLIRRAFPIELTETLSKSQVRVEMPVTIHTN